MKTVIRVKKRSKPSNKKYIRMINDGVTFDVKDAADCIDAILDEYGAHDSCIGEILASTEIVGFSSEDVVDIYATVMNMIEGDVFAQFQNIDIELEDLLKSHEDKGDFNVVYPGIKIV